MATVASSSQSLERGLAMLSAFKPATPELGISDLARELGLTRSTSHRYAATLARLGYLQQNPQTRKYRLGPRVLDLGFSAINSMELRQIALPDLQQLSDATGHTVNMAVLDGLDIVYVERCRSASIGQREIDLNLHVGSRLPAYCTSMGKVLLADLNVDELEERLERMELAQRGPNTITSPSRLREELARVRRDGMAVNDEELAYGLRSIAVAVRGAEGNAVAAINLAAHRSLVSLECLIGGLGPPLLGTARAISSRLGFQRGS